MPMFCPNLPTLHASAILFEIWIFSDIFSSIPGSTLGLVTNIQTESGANEPTMHWHKWAESMTTYTFVCCLSCSIFCSSLGFLAALCISSVFISFLSTLVVKFLMLGTPFTDSCLGFSVAVISLVWSSFLSILAVKLVMLCRPFLAPFKPNSVDSNLLT